MVIITLTDDMLARFVGGQLEVADDLERELYRGEVSEAKVVGDKLEVAFNWMAKAKEVPGNPGDQVFPLGGWVAYDLVRLELPLIALVASDIGDNRLALHTPDMSYLAVFYPPDGSKLDPNRVEGLVLS